MAALKLVTTKSGVDPYNPVQGDIYLTPQGATRLTATLGEEVQQLLLTRFRFFQGEWYLDPTLGFPWFQSILGVKQNQSVVANLLRRVIIGCPGVKSLDNFSLNQVGRSISLVFSCTLADGTILKSSDFAPFVFG